MLKIKWDFPKSLDLKPKDEHTVVQARMYAVPREEALALLTEKDKRPLLVLRECTTCKGSDDALLSRKLDNERTKLLTRWFHCVKLRPHVLDKTHTYHNLFAGEKPPHLFLATADGETVIPMDGAQSQALLWKDMHRVLKASYRKDPAKAVKQLFQLMAKYDHLDSMESMLQEQLEAELEKNGPRSSRLKRIQKKLAKVRADKKKTKAKEAAASDLGLIEPKVAK